MSNTMRSWFDAIFGVTLLFALMTAAASPFVLIFFVLVALLSGQ